MNMTLALPIILIVGSNIFYNIATKAMPEGANAFAALVVTYLLAALCSLIFMLIQLKGFSLEAFKGINWTSALLAMSITVLETGYILAFRAGWNISVCSLVANILLAVALLVIGLAFYHETVTLRQAGGMAVCLFGLILINMK